jgi:hypothetical protein
VPIELGLGRVAGEGIASAADRDVDAARLEKAISGVGSARSGRLVNAGAIATHPDPPTPLVRSLVTLASV